MALSAPFRRALISVSDKSGLVEFARQLAARGIEIYSTGGTRQHLASHDIPVLEVSDYTGFPEIMDGRVKTLHPRIHGGILARRDHPEDLAAMTTHGILPFELVVVNLYPFAATVARPDVSDADAIENIDIGGPSLIRGAAKNHAFVTIATSTDQYPKILAELAAHGATTYELRRELAGAAYEHTSAYDRMIADYFARPRADGAFPAELHLAARRTAVLRYGENPHQAAALYADGDAPPGLLATARQLHGKELSYNNLLDLDSAAAIVRGLAEPSASVIKHNNPCGAASAQTLQQALLAALAGDPVSAFGSVLGVNRPFDLASAEVLCDPNLFVEAIVAPSFEPAAVEALTTRPKWKANVRLIEANAPPSDTAAWDYRRIQGGWLMQTLDSLADPEGEWTVVTQTQPTPAQMADLRFGWALVRHVKSNAIVLAKNSALLGVGAGQMSRVDSVEIAIRKAGEQAPGSALASDAFFPFADSIERAATAGVAAFIQPGGSRRDEEVIAACNAHNLPMIFTGRRHFKH
jgi:phosphoribosylaminoimidazolecarboxamide formyltransferase/IMP cyclohydrolase